MQLDRSLAATAARSAKAVTRRDEMKKALLAEREARNAAEARAQTLEAALAAANRRAARAEQGLRDNTTGMLRLQSGREASDRMLYDVQYKDQAKAFAARVVRRPRGETRRGDAAAETWRVHGDESTPRPRRGECAETSRGGVAATPRPRRAPSGRLSAAAARSGERVGAAAGIDPKWNCDGFGFKKPPQVSVECQTNAAIRHWSGHLKPWRRDGKYKSYFYSAVSDLNCLLELPRQPLEYEPAQEVVPENRLDVTGMELGEAERVPGLGEAVLGPIALGEGGETIAASSHRDREYPLRPSGTRAASRSRLREDSNGESRRRGSSAATSQRRRRSAPPRRSSASAGNDVFIKVQDRREDQQGDRGPDPALRRARVGPEDGARLHQAGPEPPVRVVGPRTRSPRRLDE